MIRPTIIDAGELNVKIQIEKNVETASGELATKNTTENKAIMWAKVTPASDAKIASSMMQISQVITHVIIVRYINWLTNDHRIVFDGYRYLIKGIRNLDYRRNYLSIQATKSDKIQ